MKIALVTLNPVVGDVAGNTEKICHYIDQAIQAHCQLVIFPEMSLIGYPPKDLIFLEALWERQNKALLQLKRKSKKITIVVGGFCKNKNHGPLFQNVAFVFKNGQKEFYAKRLLPHYDVFDECRYFAPGLEPLVLKIGHHKFGLSICEDIWAQDPWLKKFYQNPFQKDKTPIDTLINISASPYEFKKQHRRQNILQQTALELGCRLIYVNQSGANDDLIFNGRAFVVEKNGRFLFASQPFLEQLCVIDLEMLKPFSVSSNPEEDWNSLRQALKTGIADYVHKSGFHKVVLGLSGGIDSALVAQLAAEALGPENVLGVLMPSRYSSSGSLDDALILAKNLKIQTKKIEIETLHKSYEIVLKKIFDGETKDLTAQNIQARIRGNLLMALSNNTGALLLNTTNKSEMAMGYGTLYGDMCGALAVISDLKKDWVFQLAKHMNPKFEIIPKTIFTKEPSAELKPNQKDSDHLPPYEKLDPYLKTWIEKEEVTELAYAKNASLIKTYLRNEYKRYQSPIGLKVTRRAFGTGRRYPLVTKF